MVWKYPFTASAHRTTSRSRDERDACTAAGDKTGAAQARRRTAALGREYKSFCEQAGLTPRPERMRSMTGPTVERAPKVLDKRAKSGIIKADIKPGGGNGVQTIGKIDIEKYKVVSQTIRTSEVIITDERIGHIQERHPNDFERYASYLRIIVEEPDYILEANKPNTAFLLKEIIDSGERFQLILRLAVSDDPDEYKNSVITFLRVEKKRYLRYLRTKKILYKSE